MNLFINLYEVNEFKGDDDANGWTNEAKVE